MIYFAVAGDGRVKIGTTKLKVSARLRQVSAQLAAAPSLLGSIEGGHPLERAIHAHLAKYRLNGEWFRDCPEVRKTIRNLILGGGAAIGFKGSIEVVRISCERSAKPGPLKFDHDLFARMAYIVWGDDAVTQLASLAQVNADIASRWIDKTVKPPRIVCLATFGLFAGKICTNYEDESPRASARRSAA